MDWDDVDGASHYLVRWRVAGPGNKLNTGVEVQSSNISITVADYGEWVVRVEAYNDAGHGSPTSRRFKVELATTPTPEPTPTPTGLVPSFSLAISGVSFNEGEEITETTLITLPEAEGGDGELTYSLTPALPEGLTFDPATRTISGTPTETGEFEMTYTAADEHGDKASFDFTITVQAAPRTAKSATLPVVPNLSVTRTRFDGQSAPALDVSWGTPDYHRTNLGYGLQYRVKTKEWNKALGFDSNTHSTTLTGLQPGTEYEVRVNVKYAVDGFSNWSSSSARTNRPPTAGSRALEDAQLIRGPFATYSTAAGRWPDYFTDADGDTLTPSVQPQYPGLLKALASTGTDYSIRVIGLNPGKSKLTYGVSDGYGGVASKEVTYTIVHNPQREIMENSAAGTAVGAPVAATPYGEETYTHTLTGEAATSGKFVIDSATGQISVAEGATLDYETKSSYTGKVSWTVQGQAAVANLTINIADVEAGKPGTPTLTRTEFSEQTAPALDVTWTAADANGATITGYEAQYRKKAAAGQNPAAWTAYTGTLSATATSLNLANLEAGATYEVQVRALTSKEGPGPWSDTGTGRTNRPPGGPDPVLPSRPIYSGTEAQYDVLRWRFWDVDSDTLTYWATAEHPGILEVSVSSDLSLNIPLTIDAHNPGSTTVSYGVYDSYGGHASGTVTITARAFPRRSVAERSPAGTLVGDPVTGTPYGEETLTYTLTGEAANAFEIDAATGQIKVKQGATLDFETTPSYTGKVNWTVQGQAAAADLTIKVTDVEAGKPGTPTVTRTEFSEPTNPALDVTWTAAAANGLTITGYEAQYRKSGSDEWTDYTGTLDATATTFNLPNLEAGATYEARVRAVTSEEADGPWSDTGEGTANRAPNAIDTALFSGGTLGVGGSFAWHEEAPLGSGPFFADADGDALTYSASAEHPALLGVSLSGAAGSAVLTANLLNQGASKVNYVASDPYGGQVTRTTTITITAKTSRSIAENSAAGTAVGDPVTGTPYNGVALTYTLTGKAKDSGLFVIASATGQISVATGASIDYETDDTHREIEYYNGEVFAKFYRGKVNYTVDGHASAIEVLIQVTDVEPGQPGTPTLTRTQFRAPTNPALDVAWTAAAANGLTITGYEVQYRVKVAEGEEANDWTLYKYDDPDDTNDPPAKISLLPATTTSINLPDLTAGATYEAQVRAVTSEEADGPWSDTGEGKANTPPNLTTTLLSDTSVAWFRYSGPTIQHNLATGGYFQDADSDTLTYTASSEYPGVIKAWMKDDGVTMAIQARNPAAATVTYGVHDAYGGYASRTFEVTGTANTTGQIYENACCGRYVRNVPSGAGTHTLAGDAFVNGPFAHDSATGWISLGAGKSLDYETKSSYTGQISWTVEGQTATATITINVIDVEANKPATPTLTRTEFSEPTAPALDVSWTQPALTGEAFNRLQITGYEVQYRVKVAQGEDPAAWTLYKYDDPADTNDPPAKISLLPATPTSVTLPGLTAGETYEAQVRAIAGVEGPGPWSDTGEGTANRAPTASSVSFLGGTLGMGGSFAWHEKAPLGSGAFFTDADSDTLTYTASAEHPALLGVSLSGAAGAAVLTANLLNQGTSKVNYVASDGYGGQVTRSTTITITAKTAREVAENSAGGTNVGTPVTGTPYNGVALTYTLQGKAKDSGLFVINSATGQISVAENAVLDYEAEDGSYRETETYNGQVIAKFYRGEVHYTVDGHASVINVIIKVTDAEAGQPGTPTLTRTQFSEPTNPALDVTWTAAAANGTTITGYEVQYRVKAAQGEDPAAWTLYKYDDPADTNDPPAKISLLPATATSVTLPDLEAGATYEVQVRAVTSEEAEGPWSDIGEGTANTPPNLTATFIADFSLQWFRFGNSLSAQNLSNGLFQDADNDTLTYDASSEYPKVIQAWIETNTLKIRARNPAAATVTYGARDAYGGYASRTVEVTGTVNTITGQIYENACCGRYVRLIKGDGGTYTYTLTGDAFVNGPFVHDATTGWISLGAGKSLDYETKSSYTGTLSWTVEEQTATATITINVIDLEANKPATPTLTRTEFSEPTAPALDVSWTAPALTGEAFNRLQITGYEVQYRVKVAEGETENAWTLYKYDDPADTNDPPAKISLLPATPTSVTLPDLTAGATYEVQVRAIAGVEGPGPWSDTGEGRANRPPTTSGTGLADSTIAVNTATDYAISDKFTDADSDTLTYSASAAQAGVLTTAITGNDSDTLRVTVINPAASVVTYGVSDGYGGYVSRTVTITGTAAATRSVAENAAAGTAVGTAVTGTPYNGGKLTYTLTGEASTSGAFEIDSATGQIKVKQGAILDYETKSSYTGLVEYTVQGQAAVINVTINLTDMAVPEPPAAPAVTPAAAAPTTTLDVAWTAPANTSATIIDYDVQYRQQAAEGEGPEAWTAHPFSGAGTTTTLTGLLSNTAYEVQVRATNGEGTSLWSATGTGRTDGLHPKTPPPNPGDPDDPDDNDDNDDPDFGSSPSREIAENSPAGTAVGAPVTAADRDGDALTYALTGSSTFVIDPASGQIRVATGAVLDYEARSSYSVTLTVTDGKDAAGATDPAIDDTVTVTITVLNVNEPPAAPAAPAVTPAAAAPTTTLDVTWTAPANHGRPVIGDYDVQYRVAGTGGWQNQLFHGPGTATTLTGLQPDTSYEVQVRAANIEGIGPWSAAGTGTTQAVPTPTPNVPTPQTTPPPNATPTPQTTPQATPPNVPTPQTTPPPNVTPTPQTTPQATPPNATPTPEVNLPPRFPPDGIPPREIPEDTPPDSPVGPPVQADDPDGEDVTYTVDDDDDFTIDPDTGQITVAPDAQLEPGTYILTVTATDSEGSVATATVTITVTDVDEPSLQPTGLAAGSSSTGGGGQTRSTTSDWWSNLWSNLWSPFNIAAMVSLLMAGLASLVTSAIKLGLEQGSWLWLMPIVARRREQPATAGAAAVPITVIPKPVVIGWRATQSADRRTEPITVTPEPVVVGWQAAAG